jgi:hypothetical protein
MKICNKCFQIEHNSNCNFISHPTISIELETHVPYSVILAILEEAKVRFTKFTYSYKSNDLKKVNKSTLTNYLTIINNLTIVNKKDVIAFDYKPDCKATIPSILLNIVIQNILNVPKDEMKIILPILENLGVRFYDNIITRDVFYTKIRKPFLVKYGKNSPEYIETLELMKITKEQRLQINEDYRQNIKNKNKTPKIFYSEDILTIIEKCKYDENWAIVTIGLMLAYGGRLSEILYKNEFEINDNNIIVKNIGKKREDKKNIICVRPVIGYTPEEFIYNVTLLRNSLNNVLITEGNDKGQLKKKYSKAVKEKMYELFNKDYNPSLCRKIYGNLAYLLYGENQNLNVFLADILGHDKNDLTTSFSYSTICVKNR